MMIKQKNTSLSSGVGYFYSWASIALVISVCLLIIITIAKMGIGVISINFLITEPNASAIDTEAGGILTPLIGTILLTIIGVIISIPISLATAISLVFYSKKGFLHSAIQLAIDILAGVPTVVIALFSLAIFTKPWLAFLSTPVENVEGISRAYGKSFLVAGTAMAIMILPSLIKSMVESLKTVPQSYIDGAYALGDTKWGVVSKIALLSARPGIVTGIILGMGRIIGDTAIVWLALGGTLRMTGAQPWYMPENWLSTLQNTGSTLTSYIYYTSPAGEGNNFTVAFGASLILIIIIIILNTLISILGNMGRHRERDI